MLSDLVVLSLATATISVTVTQSILFKPIRDRVSTHWTWGGDLIHCSYCLGHWVACVLVTISSISQGMGLVTGLVSWLAVTAIAAMVSGLIERLYDK